MTLIFQILSKSHPNLLYKSFVLIEFSANDLFKKVLEVAINEHYEDELLNAQILTKDELESFKNNNL